MPPEQDRNKPAPENVEEKSASTVSERKIRNKPKPNAPARGPRQDWKNSFSPVLKGSLTLQVCYDRHRNPIQAVNELYGSLCSRYDNGDVVSMLLIDLLTASYARLSKGLQHETKFFGDNEYPFGTHSLPSLMRYLSSGRRDLDNTLKLLSKIGKEAAEESFELCAEEAEPQPSPAAAPSQSDSTQEESEEHSPQVVSAASTDAPHSVAQPSTTTEAPSEESQITNNANVTEGQPSEAESGLSADATVSEQAPPVQPQCAANVVEMNSGTSDADSSKAA